MVDDLREFLSCKNPGQCEVLHHVYSLHLQSEDRLYGALVIARNGKTDAVEVRLLSASDTRALQLDPLMHPMDKTPLYTWKGLRLAPGEN